MKEIISKIIWNDACELEVDKRLLKTIHQLEDGRELLIQNTTYGKIIKKLKNVIVIMTEESDGKESTMTFIPRDWIIKIEEFTKK